MLCGSLDGRGVGGRMDTCVCMAETLLRLHETITTMFAFFFFPQVWVFHKRKQCLPIYKYLENTTELIHQPTMLLISYIVIEN